MPWEQGVWKDLFKPNSAITEPALLFRRPVFKMNRAVEETSSEPDAKRSKPVVRLVSGWADIIKSGEDICWQDQKEAKMQTALKRCLDVALRFPDTIELKVMLQQQLNVQAQLRMIRNILWRKAPGTLLKRVNSLYADTCPFWGMMAFLFLAVRIIYISSWFPNNFRTSQVQGCLG